MTAAVDPVAVGAATLPYALANLGEHIIDHALPSPHSVDASARQITVWLLDDDVPAWRATTDTLTDPVRTPGLGAYDAHTCTARLHGSCVEVTFHWITYWPLCVHPDCRQPVAPADAPKYDAGCCHGRDLCSLHRLHCEACVADLREDRAVALADGLRDGLRSWGADA